MSVMNDEMINSLSGRELDEAVCLASGWTHNKCWHPPTDNPDLKEPHQKPYGYSDNLGAAMNLLMTLDVPEIQIAIGGGEILIGGVARGPKEDAATLLSRSYLKLRKRS